MDAEDVLLDTEDKMEKALEYLKNELKGIRTGRASAGLVENIRVNCYGSQTILKQMANITVPEPQLIVIKPYDPSITKEIEKAIMQSEMGLTPSNDGKVIRIPIPPLSEETRKKLAHRVKELGEETKVAIRNLRRDANKQTDKLEKDSVITEDDADTNKKEIQKLTDDFSKKVDELLARKTEEIMKI